jgi:hypothetical protein
MTQNTNSILDLIAKQIQKTAESNINPAQAEKAIYIDFEGLMDAPPSLIGIMVDGEFTQHVFDTRLLAAAKHSNLNYCDGTKFLSELVQKASNENRRIVAFSSYEKQTIKKYYDIDIADAYADARLIAKALRPTIFESTGLKPRDLKSYLTAINYKRGDYLGIKQTAPRIRAVASMLEKKPNFEDLTPTVKAKWTKVLQHNRIDVEGMRMLVLLSAEQHLSKEKNKPRSKRLWCFTPFSNISSNE